MSLSGVRWNCERRSFGIRIGAEYEHAGETYTVGDIIGSSVLDDPENNVAVMLKRSIRRMADAIHKHRRSL